VRLMEVWHGATGSGAWAMDGVGEKGIRQETEEWC